MKIDRQTLVAWAMTLMLIGASAIGAWLVVGDNGEGWLSLLHRLEALSAREPLLTALIFAL
ncbi:MAG: hypothetical protein LC637_01755, partial [Xanthomonadaceae bacterium]|nr:hypothetical protein [Xanthomonadaceae bacterium]